MAVLLAGCGIRTGYAPVRVTVHQGSAALLTAAPRDSLRVAAWNIQYGLDVEGALKEIKADSNLATADVILLQEMGPVGIRTIAAALGLNHVYGPASVSPHHAKLFGNGVLSRWPIINTQILVLPHETMLTGHRRIAVAADIALPQGRNLRAISVHTATMVMDQDKRIEQAAAIMDSLGAFAGPIVLGGDFNTVSDYEVTLLRRTMRRLGLDAVRLPPGPTIRNKYKKMPGSVPVLDHLFSLGLDAGSRGIADQAVSSDHLPIWAVFAFPTGPDENEP